MLADGLIERINQRIKDDWRRTGDGDWPRTPKELRRKQESPTIMAGLVGSMIEGILAFDAKNLEPLKPIVPLTEKAVAKVEKSLGFAVPNALRQLYLYVGDGGFGPFNGIRRLVNWAKDYAKLRADLAAERGREWPDAMLPIVYLNGKRLCVDRDSGAVILWTKPPKKASEKKWLASFVAQSHSLEQWLERWVDTPTWCEGGPEGGWTPPDEEIQRRETVETDNQARRAAEQQRAMTFVMGDIPALDPALLDRVRARAMDPDNRTYLASTEREPGGLLSGLLGPLGLRMVGGGGPGMMMMRRGSSGKLGAPASERDFAAAEKQLGFALPAPLRQLHAIADGGFGPGGAGLWPLVQAASEYREKISRPEGPVGEPWPARLLPLCGEDGALSCLDLESGKIVNYDVERMDHEGPGQWRRSFAPEAPSLAAWLEAWLVSGNFRDEHEQQMRAAKARWAEEAIATFEAMSDEERAGHGLSGPDWRDEVRRRAGLAPGGD